MRGERALPLVVLLVVGACAPEAPLPPEGHLEVLVRTDAPLPSSRPGPAAVFDTVRFEVLRSDGSLACDACAREVPLTREDVEGGATFTVLAREPTVLRARLFSSRLGRLALEPGVVVERWSRLPAAPAEGTRRVPLDLLLEDVGRPAGSLASPTEVPPEGAATDPLPSLAPPAPGPAERDDEACVPGGWFWLGSPRVLASGELDPGPPRLAYVAPFCVDAHETTVRELRATKPDGDRAERWSGTTSPTDPLAFCPYTEAPGPNEDRAAACVTWDAARASCTARGRDLPTEAQLEYLMSGLGAATFVWGEDVPSCEEAIVARAVGSIPGDATCTRDRAHAFLPLSSDALGATRDVLVVGERRITGLASNVAEWTREAFALPDEHCGRAASGVLADPECPVTAATTRIAVRGGAFTASPPQTAASARAFVARDKLRVDLGFRCVRPAR